MQIMNASAGKKVLPLLSYVTVGLGLLVFHNAWIAILSYHAGMTVVIVLSRTGIPLKHAWRGRRARIPLITALAGIGGGLLLYLFWDLLSVPDDINAYAGSIGLTKNSWPLFLAYFILVNPVIEEYFWRGFLASDARQITINDLMFSGYHLIVLAGHMETLWLIPVFFSMTFGAWFWRQMNRLNDGLLASTVSHLAADITVILSIYYLTTY